MRAAGAFGAPATTGEPWPPRCTAAPAMVTLACSPAAKVAELDLRETLDRMADGLLVYDRAWRVLYMNQSAETYFQRSRDEVVGKIVWEAFPAAVGTEAERRLRDAASRNAPSELELLAPAMQRWVAFRVFPSESRVVVFFRDITEKKKIEDALRTSEARHRAMVQNAIDGILRTAPTGEIFAANEAACRMLGRTEDEIRAIGRDGILDRDDPRLAAALEERRRTGHVRAELTCIRKDGARIPVEVSSAVYRDADGNERTSLMFRDLTEKKRAEDRLRLVADAGAVIGRTLDRDVTVHDLARLVAPRLGDVCLVDDALERELRRAVVWGDDRPVAKEIARIGPPGPLGEARAGLHRVARTGEAELVADVDEAWLVAVAADDEHLRALRAHPPRSAMVVPMIGRAGVVGVVTLLLVAGDRRYDASDLAAARALADRAALALENARLYEQAVQAKRLRDEVLGVVSHDLRGPLNAIRLSAAHLARSTAAPQLAVIDRAARRADALTQDLLTVAALEAGAMPLARRIEAIPLLVDEAVDLQRALAAERSITLGTALDPDLPAVNVDRHRLLQVLGNLLGNAVKFTPIGGHVQLDVHRLGDEVAFRVSDTGPGIAPDALPHVFDRFWQGEGRRRGGAGLGLSIAKGIVVAHGGAITAESEPGHGAVFTFTIPCE